MRDITMTEWLAIETALAKSIAARWPWMHDGGLRVCTPILTAHAESRWSFEQRFATVQITIDSSGCVSGGALDIANAARMFSEVRDAMLFVHGETSGLVIWRDGECPCGYCSGKGTTYGAKCTRCNGGKR